MTNETNLQQPPAGADEQPAGGGERGTRPPLRREHGILGGVAAGLARYFDVEPWIIRLVFLLLLFPGIGVLLYAAGWLLIPAAGTDESIGERWLSKFGGENVVGTVLIVLAGIWLLTMLSDGAGGFGLAVALLIIGVLLFRGDLGSKKSADGSPAAPAQYVTPTKTGEIMPPLPPSPTLQVSTPPPPPKPKQPPSMLGRLTLAAVLVGTGVMAIFETVGTIEPSSRHYLGLALAITAAGLLVGAVWGRSRALIALGLVLLFALGGALATDIVTDIEATTAIYAPVLVAEIQPTYHLDAGSLVLDFSDVNLEGRSVDVRADIGAGQIEVILGADQGADINARTGVGRVEILGRSSEGLGVGRSDDLRGTSGTLILDLDAGVGEIVVTQQGIQEG
ncbi:MAG: PspC domain-containing protein [Acidimicrobiia bacterium]|nr:PspC domain-containing protein [Acidimicrobiia bacterium]